MDIEANLILPDLSDSSFLLRFLPAFIFLVFFTILLHFYLHYQHYQSRIKHPKAILVLSQTPANHSPRTCAHISACLHLFPSHKILFIAQPPCVLSNSNIQFFPIPIIKSFQRRTPYSLLKKLLASTNALITSLHDVATAQFHITHIIINSPPALPTIPLVILISWILFPRVRIIIDWHNTAFSIMQTTNAPYLVVLVAKFIEAGSARFAHIHWTVSKAMANFLKISFGVKAHVVPDAPRLSFQQLARNPPNKKQVLDITKEYSTRIEPIEVHNHLMNHTDTGTVPVIVTSTSWTPDEDFEILFNALRQLDLKLNHNIRLVVTGRGPLREHYEQKVSRTKFRKISVWFAWLPLDEYPRLLAVADVGISLHTSSSGLDLPMKVVDMLATGCPVLSVRYQCIDELIVENETGILFDNENQLSEILQRLIYDEKERLTSMKSKIIESFGCEEKGWINVWKKNALPSIKELGNGDNGMQ